MDGIGVVEAVAKKRGCMIKGRRGGELDLEKAAMILLTDYRGGKLGRISLETPPAAAAMLVVYSLWQYQYDSRCITELCSAKRNT
jgi:ribosome biogenesis GTPase A